MPIQDSLAVLQNLLQMNAPTPGPAALTGASDDPLRRNNAKVAMLRNLFKLGPDIGDISQADLEQLDQERQAEEEVAAQQKAYPAMAAGKANVEAARVHGAAGIEEARLQAERAASMETNRQNFQASQNDLNRQQQQKLNEMITGRQQEQSQLTDAQKRLLLLQQNKLSLNPPGIIEGLKRLVGLSPDLNAQEIRRVQTGATPMGAGEAARARAILDKYGSFEAAVQAGLDPSQVPALQAALGQ
jgi:hypothetical protein